MQFFFVLFLCSISVVLGEKVTTKPHHYDQKTVRRQSQRKQQIATSVGLAGAGVAGVAVTAEMLAAAGSSSRDDDVPKSCAAGQTCTDLASSICSETTAADFAANCLTNHMVGTNRLRMVVNAVAEAGDTVVHIATSADNYAGSCVGPGDGTVFANTAQFAQAYAKNTANFPASTIYLIGSCTADDVTRCAEFSGDFDPANVATCAECKSGTLEDGICVCTSQEICDGQDNDCDGETDEDILDLPSNVECIEGALMCTLDGASPTPYSDVEICDGVDNDCDVEVDEDLVLEANEECIEGALVCRCDGITGCGSFCAIRDQDTDGFANAHLSGNYIGGQTVDGYTCPSDYAFCQVPSDGDDCDDNDAEFRPGAKGICNCSLYSDGVPTSTFDYEETCDGLDNNCNGDVDEDIPDLEVNVECINGALVCKCTSAMGCDGFCAIRDVDGDGHMAADLSGTFNGGESVTRFGMTRTCPNSVAYCIIPADGDDCDDDDFMRNPSQSEFCDFVDNNCNGETDEDALDALIWYETASCLPTPDCSCAPDCSCETPTCEPTPDCQCASPSPECDQAR